MVKNVGGKIISGLLTCLDIVASSPFFSNTHTITLNKGLSKAFVLVALDNKNDIREEYLWTCNTMMRLISSFQGKKTKAGKAEVTTNVKQDTKLRCLKGSCGQDFSSVKLLLAHQYEKYHLANLCSACDKTFTELKTLRRHIKSLHLQEQFVCQQCLEVHSFNKRDNFFVHQLKCYGKGSLK